MISTFFERARSMASTIGFADILDVLVVALLIFGILLRIRSTSALRIASAIVLILLVTWFTDIARMRTIHFLLSKILEIGMIALIIVFQPELRRLLERVGSRSLSILTRGGERTRTDDQVIDRAVNACEIMSGERTGVLLVFEREIALDDYFKSGTLIDAEVSTELLRNLFFTKASLHDGAVIIRGNRIAAAGCVLPLTDNTSISSDLGTRHRAAIGISEASDAVAVIVSEETGMISAAVGGMLKRSLSADTLKRLLNTELRSLRSDAENDNIFVQIRNWFLDREEEQTSGEEKKEEHHEAE